MVAAEVEEVSRAAVQLRVVVSPRGRQFTSQRARHHARKTDSKNLTAQIEVVAIARSTVMMHERTASNIVIMHGKIARTLLKTSGMTTMIVVLAQP